MSLVKDFQFDGSSTPSIADTWVLPLAPQALGDGVVKWQPVTVSALRTQLNVATTSNPQFNSLGLGTAASGTAGDLLATTATFGPGQTQVGNISGNTALRIQNTALGGSKAWSLFPVTRGSHSDLSLYDIEVAVTRLTFKEGATFVAFGDLVVGVPAFKAVATTIAARLGDDSADAPVTALSLLVSGAAGGIGYAAGAGGTITQGVSKTTGVTLNTLSGAITTNNASLAAGTIVSFVLTDTSIAATDVLVLNHISGGTIGSYTLNAQAAAGSATINIRNNTAGALAEAIVIQFVVIKGVNA